MPGKRLPIDPLKHDCPPVLLLLLLLLVVLPAAVLLLVSLDAAATVPFALHAITAG